MQIVITALSKSYGSKRAVDNLDINIKPGTITGLVGPNGAGKSTLLRMMAGRELPDEGDVRYDDISVVDFPDQLAGIIGFMPDSLPESTTWTVEEYLDFQARANNLTGDTRQKRLDDVIAFTGVTPLLRNTLSQLSKGLKQRVSLARVLIGDPKVLLLDEPAAGLDPRARMELRESIRNLAKQGKTIIVSSHILADLEDMCDNMVILECGKLQRQGAIADLATTPKDGGPQLQLEFAEVTPQLMTQLQNLPNAKSCSQCGRRTLQVEIAGGDKQVQEFMIALFTADMPLIGYRRGGNLESIFMDSTTGNVQ